MENMLLGATLTLAAGLMAWFGVRQRRSAQEDYARDAQRYTAGTVMKVVRLEESTRETWEDRDDGTRELRKETVYLPTYEYTVDGRTYQYQSRKALSGKWALGRQVPGYYDPADPETVTEDQPRKPVLGGFFFFAGAALLLAVAIMAFTGQVIYF